MATNIRPYISVAESISQTTPNLLDITMPGIIIGTAVDEKTGFASELDFTLLNNASISTVSNLDETGKVFKIAGIRPGTTLDVSTLKWGGDKVVTVLDFGTDKEFHTHVQSSTEKYILVLESGDNYVTEQDLLSLGVQVGDTVTIDPVTADQEPFSSKIRSFGHDENGNLQIFLWDEVPYDVDEGNSLTGSISKEFYQVPLATNGLTFDAVPYFGDSVLIKGPGTFSFEYYVYQPTDEEPTFDNIKVSKDLITLVNMTSSKITTVAKDGELYNWFTANRTDIANQIIDVDYNTYKTTFGEPSEKNKLGTMFSLVANEIPGFRMKAYVVPDDSDDSYITALNILATSTQAYEVACLTDSDKVMDALNGMAERAADPLVSAYKLGIFCPRMPIYTKKITVTDATITANDDGSYTIESVTGGFSLADIKVGDYIIGDQDLAIADSEYYDTVGEPYTSKMVAKVTSVTTDKKIVVSPTVSTIDVAAALDGQNVVIVKMNSKDEIREAEKNYALGYDDMHLVLVFPDKFIIGDKLYAGYYIAGLTAAVLAHLPPQQGLSNLSFNTIDRVIGSAFYFSDAELDDIASAGITVITQVSYDSKPYIIRQLTTNMSSLEEMEINKVRCLDYAALEVKAGVDDYIGKRNVTERNVIDLKEKITSILTNIINTTKNDLLGSVIIDYTINYIAIPEDEPDAIDGDIEVTTPTSLNAIRLFIKSKS